MWVEVLRRYSKLPPPPDPSRFGAESPRSDRRPTQPAHCVARRLGPDKVDELLQRYQLATDYGLQRSSVRKLLRQHGIEPRRRSLTRAEIQRAAELYATGLTVAQVADQLGRHHTTVQVALRRHGVQLRSRHDYD
jgi:histone H3/H4